MFLTHSTPTPEATPTVSLEVKMLGYGYPGPPSSALWPSMNQTKLERKRKSLRQPDMEQLAAGTETHRPHLLTAAAGCL